ncbi:MAG: hypothetical protein K9M01_02085 [Candidatus Omnitrophica bacterium]|nr:hypothetical protein [Candidatus Omnitrophota bacterium]
MSDDFFSEFFLGGADELVNSQECPHCGYTFYLDQKLEWIDKENNICKCPNCGKEVEID